MTEKQNIQTNITVYIENFLEEHFGGKPDQLTVTFHPPFLLLHLDGFVLPGEELFIRKGEWNSVLKTRDIIIQSLKADLLNGLQEFTDQKLDDLYVDWNLLKRSGLLMITMENAGTQEKFPWPPEVQEEILREIIILNSIRTQKQPDQTNFYWLSDKILLVERIGILIDIEKELLQNGVSEELRLAKRPMEHRITELFNLESILNNAVQNLFVDWNFQKDLSFMVLLLKK